MTTTPKTEASASPVVLTFELHHRMDRALEHAGIGVGEMASTLGVTRETVGRWIHGHNVPKRAALIAWASLTNVDLEWLETGKAPKRARRDSNPKPSDLYPVSVIPSLTPNRRTGTGRTLRLVAGL